MGQPYQINIAAFNANQNEQPWCCSSNMMQLSGTSTCIASKFCSGFSPAVNMYQLPGVPTGLTFEPYGNKILKAGWTPPSYTGGQTDRGLDFEVRLDGAVIFVSNNTAYLSPQYTEGTSHTIQVRAINSAGRGSWSAEVNAISMLLQSVATPAASTEEGVISTTSGLPLNTTARADSTVPAPAISPAPSSACSGYETLLPPDSDSEAMVCCTRVLRGRSRALRVRFPPTAPSRAVANVRAWGLAAGAAINASAAAVSILGPDSVTGCATAALPADGAPALAGWAIFSLVCGAAGHEVVLSFPGGAGPLGIRLCTVDAARAGGGLADALLYLRNR